MTRQECWRICPAIFSLHFLFCASDGAASGHVSPFSTLIASTRLFCSCRNWFHAPLFDEFMQILGLQHNFAPNPEIPDPPLCQPGSQGDGFDAELSGGLLDR